MRCLKMGATAGVLTAALVFGLGASAQEQVTSFSYQGQLQESGQPFDGPANLTFRLFDAAEAGNQIGEDLFFENVEVTDGLFTVALDFGEGAFDGSARWLEIVVGETLLTPRQEILATPQALFALEGAGHGENVVTVAKSGGDYTSVAAALSAIEPTESEPVLVFVAPGIYLETELCVVPPYTHLKGAGENATTIRSERSSELTDGSSATLQLQDNARVSDLSIENIGTTGTVAIGVYSPDASRSAELNGVDVSVSGGGGTAHYGIYLFDAEPTIKNCDVDAFGAVGFGAAINAALGSMNDDGSFPQPLILSSDLTGGTGAADATGTGYGLHLTATAVEVRDSVIVGGHRAIAQFDNGISRIRESQVQVSSTDGAFLLETSGAGSTLFYHSGLFYVGNKLAAGSTTQPQCLYSYNSGNNEVNATCD